MFSIGNGPNLLVIKSLVAWDFLHYQSSTTEITNIQAQNNYYVKFSYLIFMVKKIIKFKYYFEFELLSLIQFYFILDLIF